MADWRRSLTTTVVNNRQSPTATEGPTATATTPVAAESAASTPQPGETASPAAEPALNGNPKSPVEDNNNHHVSNNNITNMAAATMCAVNSFLRTEEQLKSPFRFDDHRSPYR